jgi:DNA (cytosine-5)-methyltransferase 1
MQHCRMNSESNGTTIHNLVGLRFQSSFAILRLGKPTPFVWAMSSMIRKTIVDCFCGLGGISIGAELAGFNVIGGFDYELDAILSYKTRFPDAFGRCENVAAIDAKKFVSSLGLSRGDVDVLAGGPPCQPYSINNHQRSTTDKRASLIQQFLEIVSALGPRHVVVENVPGLLSIQDGTFLHGILRSFHARGYRTEFTVLNAVQFGVPQRRQRLVIIASREPTVAAKAIKALRNRRHRTRTVAMALGDLPANLAERTSYTKLAGNLFQKQMRERHTSEITSHLAANLGELNLRRVRHVPQGGNWRDIPRRLLPAGMRRAKKSDHTTRYGRLNPDEPAYTLLTKCDPHWGCFVHPDHDRVLSVREAARLQSIPDDVRLFGTLLDQYRLVGNAVPPLFAKGIFEELS